MNSSKSSLSNWLLVLLLLFCFSNAGLANNEGQDQDGDAIQSFITWGDLKIDVSNSNSSSSGASHVDHDNNNGVRVIVVDLYGSGDVLTVQEAVDMVPDQNTQRVKIHILPGVYREKVHVSNTKPYISFIGDERDASKVVITWDDKAGDNYTKGGELGTARSASVTVESDYFCATGVTFENTIVQIPGVEGNQAVAFRITGDRAFFYKVRFLGSQDTLFDDSGSHYFYQCFISGVTDFIFGRAASIYQECTIMVPAHGFAIAAHKREDADEDTGFSFVDCTITGHGRTSVYLGRAWGNHSRIIYSYCDLDIRVKRGRWNLMGEASRKETAEFGEYNNTGKGAHKRTRWPKPLNDTQARVFWDRSFIKADEWLRL